MKAVILAAGRGSRMKYLTNEKPKCMLELAGKPLLQWQLAALKQGGINEIILVRGYKKELLTGDFLTIDNPNWAKTNMVASLLCALPHLTNEQLIISYSDIVYKAEHITQLIKTKEDIVITYDKNWEQLWRLRNENPLNDAETFLTDTDGRLLEIGQTPTVLSQVQGQYMGLLKFSPKGSQQIQDFLNTFTTKKINEMDMTALLQQLLQHNIPIYTTAVNGGWCECDTEQDIQKYEKALQTGSWSHDWRK